MEQRYRLTRLAVAAGLLGVLLTAGVGCGSSEKTTSQGNAPTQNAPPSSQATRPSASTQ
jgi:hypothetical protein